MPEVSVVVPMHNEADVADRLLDSLGAVLADEDFEILCVDDGSVDDTAARVGAHEARGMRVRLVRLSRRFGKEAALMAGLEEAEGAAIAFIDADLQHPPELLRDMIALWRDGADVVEGVKRSRGREPLAYRASAYLFNRLSHAALGRDLHGSSDFKLLDRQVARAILACPERNRFFRGIVAWVGFRVVELPFDVAPRAAGKSAFGVRALFRFAFSALLAFTAFPLKLVALLGAFALVFSMLLGVQTLYRYFTGTALGGFTTVILLQLILNGLLLAGIGVVALYVSELYTEAKARPLFVVRRPRPRDEPHEQREPPR
jgi:polyisoprenyl-phosphate glycosyltransferase